MKTKKIVAVQVFDAAPEDAVLLKFYGYVRTPRYSVA